MIVRLSAEAERDLEAIGDHIAADNPDRAASFVAEIERKCQALADMPRAFPLVPRYAQLGVRKRGHGSYLIFYRIEPEAVTGLHVLHGARDYEAILGVELPG